ncbi:amidohydrolase family protein [Kutzneria sp. NPDC052558]|uniref:amidohydrolase family protein n=1 Tax=Kutzneria sp. NPDC052558 TaxID=3364121 RepID=UPI0037CB7E8B
MSPTVDFHHHVLPDFYRRASEIGGVSVGGVLPARWSPAAALGFLDDAGIDVAVTSISAPGVHFGDDARARELARRSNELAADMVRDRPDRFAALAVLPLPDVDGALDELAFALDTLGMDGVVLLSNARGVYLGDDRFEPVFAELQRRRSLVFVHPTVSPDPSAHMPGVPDTLLDFVTDTSRAITRMHYAGTFARTPDVDYVISHAGGTIPYLANRFAIVDEMGVVDGIEVRGAAADLFRRLHWDTALSWAEPVLTTLLKVAGPDRVVYGSDYPYLRRDLAVDSVRRVSAVLDQTVLGATALALLPRLQKEMP